MSTVLPELERLLDEAAERHYRRRRPRAVHSVIAVGAVAVVVLLVAIVGLRTNESDEHPATQRPVASADDALGNAYAILAETGPASDPALWREFQLGIMFASRASSIWRLAHEDGSRRIVVATGFNEVARKRLVCVHMRNPNGTGGAICEPAARLLTSDRPWVLPIGTGPIVLVQNDITRIWLRLADGTERKLTARNNIAIGAGYNACYIRWVRADGSSGRAPVDGAPRERCG